MDNETAKHTPIPWRVVSGAVMKDDIPIAYMDREPGNGTLPVERDENADFIVRAVNSHAGLLEALRAVLDLIDTGYLIRDISHDAEPGFAIRQLEPVLQLRNAVVAIAAVEGTPDAGTD